MKEKILKAVPRYSWLPITIVIVLNLAVYWGTKLINHNFKHYDLSLKIDGIIPVIPAFILLYVLAYLQWVVGYTVISRENKETCYGVMSGAYIAKLMCAVFFLVLPTRIARPEITATGFWRWCMEMLYMADEPTNLFPSIHCLESWLCFRCALGLKKAPWWYKLMMFVITVGVFASVVFLKQHFFVDIIAGIAIAEIGQLISKLTNSGRLLEKLNAAVFKSKL